MVVCVNKAPIAHINVNGESCLKDCNIATYHCKQMYDEFIIKRKNDANEKRKKNVCEEVTEQLIFVKWFYDNLNLNLWYSFQMLLVVFW